MTIFYDELVEQTSHDRKRLYEIPQIQDALFGQISIETYIAYLTQAYHHVKHTVPFLMSMGARLPDDKRWLHKVIIDYLQEEEGHELWILNDIQAAGGHQESVKLSVPNVETQALVAYNYDYIERKNPVGFLGMVFMLESTSCEIATMGASAIQTTLNLPDKAFTYLFSHGSLDQEHMKFFKKTVNQIDNKLDQKAIIEVAQNTFNLFRNVLLSIPHRQGVSYAA